MTESQALHRYTLSSQDDGRVVGVAWTNDNLDQGYPSEEAQWPVRYANREEALAHTGGCHVGANGCEVTVILDGALLSRQR